MHKKQHVQRTKPDETTIHIVGQERFISVQKYIGDLPSGEPTDWFPQYDEVEKLIEYKLAGFIPGEAYELLEDEWLIDEY